MISESSSYVLCPEAIDDEERPTVTAFDAFESQLKTLCLKEFPCGLGSWRVDDLHTEQKRRKLKNFKETCLFDKHSITLREYGAQHEMVEALVELATMKRSPWLQDPDWSSDARSLRELAIRTPWIVTDEFVWNHFKSLCLVDHCVTEVDANLLRFRKLEELTLTGNYIRQVNSQHLPRTLKTLELCANEISDLSELCRDAPALVHLGLGFNQLTYTDNHLTVHYWPCLRSLDLSYNHLTDLWHLVSSLCSLPMLRNLVLYGNPFTLVPAYRAYVVDSLKKLSFLDDLPVTVDERLQHRDVAVDDSLDITSAKIQLAVSELRGILPPDDILHPEDYPEYPKISRKFYVEFLFINDAVTEQTSVHESSLKAVDDDHTAVAAAAVHANAEEEEEVELLDAGGGVDRVQPSAPLTSASGLPLSAVQSSSSEWTDDPVMALDWTRLISVAELRLLRDFFVEGMTVNVVEEKILSYPAESSDPADAVPPASQKDSKTSVATAAAAGGKAAGGKADKKRAKSDAKATDNKAKKAGRGGKKKGDQVEVELIHLPAEYAVLASFHVPLKSFTEADFNPVVVTLSKEHPPPPPPDSPVDEVKREKDKKAAAAKKDAKKKDVRGVGAKDKKGAGKSGAGKVGYEDDDDGRPRALQVDLSVRLCLLTCDADTRHSAAAAATAGDVDDN